MSPVTRVGLDLAKHVFQVHATAAAAAERHYTANGLNQYGQVGEQAYCYDRNGNLAGYYRFTGANPFPDNSYVFLYDVENRLVEMRKMTQVGCDNIAYSGALLAELRYDPLGRLYVRGRPRARSAAPLFGLGHD